MDTIFDKLTKIQSWAIGDWIAVGSVLINISLGGIVVIKKIKKFRRRRRLRTLLPKAKLHLHIPSRNVSRYRNVVAQEDYETATTLQRVLTNYGYASEIRYISSEGHIDIDPLVSSIVICGPKNSFIIKEFFQTLPDIRFSEENGIWFFDDLATGNRLLSPLDQTPKLEGDLAFFGRVRLPRTGQNAVLLICGIHALGSLGIATFLETEKQLDQFMKQVAGNPFYSIIRSRHSSKYDRILETDVYLNPRIFY